MGHSRDDTPVKKQLLIEAYRSAESLKAAADSLGIPPSTARKWKKTDEEFALALSDAREDWRDELRGHVQTRAMQYWKPMFYRGEPVWKRLPDGTLDLDADFEPIQVMEPVYDSQVLQRMMEANLPEYRRGKGSGMSIGIEGGGDGTVPTKVVVNFVDPPDWDNVEWDESTGRAKLPGQESDGTDRGTEDDG